MFLCAVAKPIPEKQFNGLIGMWRIGDKSFAKRTSKNRPAGTPLLQDATMTSSRFYDMMTQLVLPAVKSKMSFAQSIVIQMDNARPHTGQKNQDALQRFVEGSRWRGPRVRFVCQPPQSPDTNVLDLCVFRSLSARVRPLTRFINEFDADALETACLREFRKFDGPTLTKSWETKRKVLRLIVQHVGGNGFKLHDG